MISEAHVLSSNSIQGQLDALFIADEKHDLQEFLKRCDAVREGSTVVLQYSLGEIVA